MKQKILAAIGAVTLLAAIIFATTELTSERAEAQTNLIQQEINKSQGNYTLKSLTILPDRAQNPTNSIVIWDTFQTNTFMFSPTNCQPIIYANGTNSVGQDADVIFTNNAGTTRHLIFKRGILVNGSSF